ncbi:DUF5114 domain-containing protein [Labilibaculum sp. K2S]|uniref:DUF5114 domain-containing protein n=1 Tax=Labilibaculum sp. K2S TaxID=3056386 RepID=UPI0025A3A2DD|nr:DUF5114 domain-containing protein [Labilibaculum sp. K2S]MDM8161504.1 DUF5114 domain-containing protein [Labilibaculum sp. K2S]
MKKLIIFLAVCCSVLFTACEKDGDEIFVSGLNSSTLLTSESDIVLSQETKDAPMLALSWNESELSISSAVVSIPDNIPSVAIEVSATQDFKTYETIKPESNIYSFTGGELNTMAKNFAYTPDVSTPMYFRVNLAYGDNTDPYYSNVIAVNITSYTIDMSKGFVLDADKMETGFVLYAPESNGEYSGFIGTTAWSNWFLKEGDGSIWGNEGADGKEFLMSSDESTMWNFWYPGFGGCYYTTASTSSKEWTATYIPNLTVSGDVTAEMTFVKSEVKWYVSVSTATDNAVVKISCSDAKLYNFSTGTSDDATISKEIGFAADANGGLTFDMLATSAGDITFGAAGDYTLTFYLADPANLHYEITSGKTDEMAPLSSYLYLPGVDDGISGSWTFDNYLRLLSEEDSTFAGVINVNSLWGYNMSLEKDNWDDVYKMGDTEGTLVFKGANNITAPDPGLYLIQTDLKNLTYNHTEVTSLSYAGFNDDWSLVQMTPEEVDGVYSGSVMINATSEYGAKLYLNGGWDYFYGGESGNLSLGADGITDDASIATGTYDLIANIKNQTYVFLGDEVYITGLNDVWDFTSVVLTKATAGVYTGTAIISADSPYGMAIHLDQSWNRYYGGSFDSMSYLGANMTEVQSLANGTYNITVDFIHNTCSFEVQ